MCSNVQAPKGFRGKELPSVLKLVSSLTRMRLIEFDMLASIPFHTTDAYMELLKKDALIHRATLAANLTEETIRALRRRPDTHAPDLSLMQSLYDSGIKQCPMSGTPIFDPSKLDEEEQAILWRAYCGVAIAIDDPTHAAAAVAALDDLRGVVESRSVMDGV